MEGGIEISSENVKEVLDLSMAFEIVFRAPRTGGLLQSCDARIRNDA